MIRFLGLHISACLLQIIQQVIEVCENVRTRKEDSVRDSERRSDLRQKQKSRSEVADVSRVCLRSLSFLLFALLANNTLARVDNRHEA